MGYSPSDVVKLIQEKDIKFVDFRFTDTKGKEQHVSVPGWVCSDNQGASSWPDDMVKIA